MIILMQFIKVNIIIKFAIFVASKETVGACLSKFCFVLVDWLINGLIFAILGIEPRDFRLLVRHSTH